MIKPSHFLLALSLAISTTLIPNFFQFLELDGVLYASIARNILESGDLFFLYGRQVDFSPFAEHPHLGFWSISLFQYLFGSNDMASRLPNFIFLVLFLWRSSKWIYVEGYIIESFVYLVVLCSMSYFTRWFASPFLDPGALFFGYMSLEQMRNNKSFLSGVFLALSLMMKGLTILGFLPGLIYILFSNRRDILKQALWAFSGFCLIFSIYYFAILLSSIPNFIDIYWHKQFIARFSRINDPFLVFKSDFYIRLLKDSNYFLLLTPAVIFVRRWTLGHRVFCFLLLISFIAMYASKERYGEHIWITVLPWVALNSTIPLVGIINFLTNLNILIGSAKKYAWILILVFPLLSLTITLMHAKPKHSLLLKSTKALAESKGLSYLYFDSTELPQDFLVLSPWAWYANLDSRYCYQKVCPVPLARHDSVYILHKGSDERRKELFFRDWCLYFDNNIEDSKESYVHCSLIQRR